MYPLFIYERYAIIKRYPMSTKQLEIEAIVEDLIDNTILELFADSFANTKECEFAFEVLKQKLEEVDPSQFKEFFSQY